MKTTKVTLLTLEAHIKSIRCLSPLEMATPHRKDSLDRRLYEPNAESLFLTFSFPCLGQQCSNFITCKINNTRLRSYFCSKLPGRGENMSGISLQFNLWFVLEIKWNAVW